MTTNKLRAKIRHNGNDIHLGYFDSKAQVVAACTAAHAALDRMEAINGKHQCPPQRLPNPKRLIEILEQGLYDIAIDEVAQVATLRHQLAKALRSSRRFPGADLYKGLPLKTTTKSWHKKM